MDVSGTIYISGKWVYLYSTYRDLIDMLIILRKYYFILLNSNRKIAKAILYPLTIDNSNTQSDIFLNIYKLFIKLKETEHLWPHKFKKFFK